MGSSAFMVWWVSDEWVPSQPHVENASIMRTRVIVCLHACMPACVYACMPVERCVGRNHWIKLNDIQWHRQNKTKYAKSVTPDNHLQNYMYAYWHNIQPTVCIYPQHLLVMSYTTTATLEFLMYIGIKLRNLSCPAVSLWNWQWEYCIALCTRVNGDREVLR